MSQGWPVVPLGEVLQLQRRWIKVQPTETYREIGIRSFGNGIFHKAPVEGGTLGDKRVLRVEPGDLVFNNVFAWEGAVAVAGPQEAGMIGSHRFITYTVDSTKASAEYIRLFFTTEDGLGILRKASPGSAGRNKTLGLERFASNSIPLPPLNEQMRLLARIDELAGKIHEARHLRQAIRRGTRHLLLSAFHRITCDAPLTPIGEVAPVVRRAIEPDGATLYHELGIRSFGKGTFHKPPIAGAALGSKRIYAIKPGDLVLQR
jgi:type I restriction enzyme S subunit